MEQLLTKLGKAYIVVLLSEIFPAKLALMNDVDAYEKIMFSLFKLQTHTGGYKLHVQDYQLIGVMHLIDHCLHHMKQKLHLESLIGSQFIPWTFILHLEVNGQ